LAPRNPTARRRDFYLLLFWVTFWPGAPLAGMAAPAVWRGGGTRRAISAGVAVPSWIVFEAVLTKLPHYVAAALPASRSSRVARWNAACCRAPGDPWRRLVVAIPSIRRVLAMSAPFKLIHQPVFPRGRAAG